MQQYFKQYSTIYIMEAITELPEMAGGMIFIFAVG